jgi:2-desacetyl-2-hydroxyethyl bacteriochlorophyllide A dehydrogenase
MRAAVFRGEGKVGIEDRPDPGLGAPDEVLIEVEACGICGTDLQITNMPPGHPAAPGVVLGHEFIGRLVQVGPEANGLTSGQRVAVDPDPKCGICGPCRAGRPWGCQNVQALGVFRDGALARYVTAPGSAVFPLAEGPSASLAALVEPLACVINGAQRAGARPGESVVIFGAGAIGCLFAAVFRAAGASPVIVVEPSEGRRAVVAAVGADVVLTPEAFPEERRRLLPVGADILVDAVGSQFATAVEHAAMGGRIVLFGQNANVRPAVHQYTITERSLTVYGSYITNFTFPAAIRMVEQGVLNLEPIVTHVLPLERLDEGLALLRSGEATKVVITP